MEPQIVIRSNWLTNKPRTAAARASFLLALALLMLSYIFIAGLYDAPRWMAATNDQVFNKHEYYRAWTSLFAHGDFGHIFSNALLFIPLGYFLSSYYGYFLFPILGLFVGGVVNLLVLKTMPPDVGLIGISGVVYWMGAVWLTLYFLVDRRSQPKRRFAHILFISLMLFAPQTYRPDVSYLSHLYGFIAGIFSAIGFYYFHKQKFLQAEVKEVIRDEIE